MSSTSVFKGIRGDVEKRDPVCGRLKYRWPGTYTNGKVPRFGIPISLLPHKEHPPVWEELTDKTEEDLVWFKRLLAKHMGKHSNVEREVIRINIQDRLKEAGYAVPEEGSDWYMLGGQHLECGCNRCTMDWWRAVYSVLMYIFYEVRGQAVYGLVKKTIIWDDEPVWKSPLEEVYEQVRHRENDILWTTIHGDQKVYRDNTPEVRDN